MAKLHTYRSNFTTLAAAFAALALVGCDGDQLVLAPAEGVVYLDGQPLADAEVLFAPVEGVPAAATTDDGGRFVLNTRQDVGAPLGEYLVAIIKLDISKLPKTSPYALDAPSTELVLPSLIPTRYNSPDTSGLTATVVAGGPEFKFELTSNP